MNVKRNPSFNILGFGTLYCGAKVINNYSKPPVYPHNMFRGANSRAAFPLLPVPPAAGGSALSLSPGRREAAGSGYGTFFGLLFLRPCPLAFAPCPGSGDAPLQGFESGCGRGGGGGAPPGGGGGGWAGGGGGAPPPKRGGAGRPGALAWGPGAGCGDAGLPGFDSGGGGGRAAPHAPVRIFRAVSHAGSSPPSRIRRDAVLSA